MKTRHILLLAATCMLSACDRGRSTTSNDAEWQELHKRIRAQIDNFDHQKKREDAIDAKLDQQMERYDKLLDRWQEQTRRHDAILDAMERQQGIKK